MSRIYITTAIPYVNAKPHIGFALELVQADTIARAWREAKHDVRFLTGTDENSIKNVQAAEKADTPTQKFVDANAEVFQKLAAALQISNDDFIRTTEPRHIAGAMKLWTACQGDIYKKAYEGLYCSGCESFYLEKDLIDGLCPEHKTRPDIVKEENYFFRLSRYQKFLEDAFNSKKIRIHPASRQNEVLNFIKEGLEDFSISRSNARAKNWGVDVPGDPSQKMYVWFDALANYITALGYGSTNENEFRTYWNADSVLHVIGKGIVKFHAIYWPAMLQAAGIFPKNGLDILVHGYVTVNGEKISKSLGNVVDPFELIERHGADAVRYFLLREIPTFEDGDYSEDKFKRRVNADLANNFGNLVQRVVQLAELSGLKDLDSIDPAHTDPETVELGLALFKTAEHIKKLISEYKFQQALASVEELGSSLNQYINAREPWKKSGVEQEKILAFAILVILAIADRLYPFTPNTAEKVYTYFGLPQKPQIDFQTPFSFRTDLLPKKGEPLFRRIA